MEVGQCFYSWEELRNALQDWSIQNQFEYQVVKKDKSRAQYCCRYKKSGCLWSLYASYNTNIEIEVKSIHSQHTCAGVGGSDYSIANTQSWLRRVIPQHLFVTKATKVQEI